MEKLSIQEFRSYRQKMIDIKNIIIEKEDELSSDEFDQKIDEYNSILATVLEYDLSEIPASEWESLSIIQTEKMKVDFSKTKANLDFSVFDEIDLPRRHIAVREVVLPNFKSCQLTNFPFDKIMYAPEMFDEEFILENPERFLIGDIPNELRERFYKGEITFKDLQECEEIRQKFLPDQLYYGERDFVKYFSREEFLKLDFQFMYFVKYWAEGIIKDMPEGKTASEVMEYLYEAAREELLKQAENVQAENVQAENVERVGRLSALRRRWQEKTGFYARPYQLGEEFRSRNPQLYIPDNAPESIVDSFNKGYLSLVQYVNNIEYFQGVYMGFAFMDEDKRVYDYFAEDMYELFKRYGKYMYAENLSGNRLEIPNDPQKTLEEKKQVLANAIKKRLEENPVSNIDEIEVLSEILPIEDIVKESKYASIISIIGIEKLKEFGYTDMEVFKDGITRIDALANLSTVLPNISIVLPKGFKLPDNYPIEEMVNHGIEDISVFSKDFSQDLAGAKELLDKGVPIQVLSFGNSTSEKREFIVKYGIDNIIKFDNETKLFSTIQWTDENSQLELLAVQEKKSPPKISVEEKQVIDYEAFRTRIYELLTIARDKNGLLTNEDFPEYGHMEGRFREEHPEIFIDGGTDKKKELFYCGILHPRDIQDEPEIVEFLKGKDLNLAFSQDIKFPELVDSSGMSVKTQSKSFAQYVVENYGEEKFFELCLEYGTLIDDNLGVFSKFKFESFEEFRKELEDNIYKSIKKGTKYSENVPQRFKDEHPELFLPEKFPIHIREKFYKGILTFENIKEFPEFATILLEKDIDVGFYNTKSKECGSSKNQDGSTNTLKYKDLFGKIKKEDLLKLSAKYGRYLETFTPEYLQDGYSSFEELEENVKASIRDGIINKEFDYGEDAPEFFKQEHPEFFISDEAPELLQLAYYRKYRRKVEGEYEKSDCTFNISFIKKHPEFRPYLEGKKLDLIKDKKIRVLVTQFTTQEILEMIDIDDAAIQLLAASPKKVELLRRNINERPKDKKNIIKCPGYTLYYSEERRKEFDFGEYKELMKMSKFTVSDNYRRDTAEQIISTMYEFLGYAAAKEILKLPELDERRVEEIITSHGLAFKELYEEKFKLKGNLRILNTLFDKFVPLLPGKKRTLNVYKVLNQKIEEGYTGTLEELLIDVMKENKLPLDKLSLVSKTAIEINTSEKLEFISDKITVDIENEIEETVANKKIIKDILMNVYRKTLNTQERLDENTIRTMLEQEFSRRREDGGTFYSPHITSHLDDLMKITKSINDSSEYGPKVNKSVIDILKEEKEKIGQGWIRKILDLNEESSKEEMENLARKLYGENHEYTIESTRFVVLKDPSEEGRKNAYIFLKELEMPGIFTYEKGEQMFVGLSKPYSENFRSFFLKNRKEILRKPEYYTVFQRMHAEFERIIEDSHVNTRFKAGEYTLEELVDELNNTTYPNVKDGEYELEYVARSAGLEKDYWPKAQEIYKKMQEREAQTIPPIEINGKKYRGRILRIDDPLHLVIGNITTCCQRFGKGQPGEPSMLHSALEKNGAVFVVEEIDEQGRVVGSPVAQSWTWRNGDRICFDNVEIPDTLENELKSKKAYDDILLVYMDAAKKMLDVDKKMLNKMLREGKITQEQYEKFIVKEITIGTGCDDLLHNLSPENRKLLTKTNTIRPLEAENEYETVSGEMKTPWIDSDTQFVLAVNEEARNKGIHSNYTGEVTIEYTKTREILRRKGRNIHKDLIKRMKDMLERAGKKETSSVGKLERDSMIEYFENIQDYQNNANSMELSCSSNDDWYILTKEEEHSITIMDSLITTGINQVEFQKSLDAKLAQYEYLNELLAVMQIAHQKGKVLKLNPEREGEYVQIEKLVKIGIIEMENGNVTVKNPNEISKMRQLLDARIEEGRRDRITGEEQGTEDKDDGQR